jgi:hypothetical protein
LNLTPSLSPLFPIFEFLKKAWLLELFEALGVTDLTRLTFSEFVDLTAIVLKSAPVPAASAAGGRLEEEEGPETNDEEEG